MAYTGNLDTYLASIQEQEQEKKKAEPRKKGTAEKVADWAPTVLGIAGGALGSVIPGAGTVAGGVAGSALGSLLKTGIKNMDSDQENNVDFKSGALDVGKEAALGLVGEGAGRLIGAVAKPVAGRLLAKAGTNLAERLAAKGGTELVESGVKAGVKKAESEIGSDLISQGLKRAGDTARKSVINPKVPVGPNAFQAEEALAKQGMSILKGGSRNAMRKQSGEAMTAIGSQIDDALSKNTSKINAGEVLDDMYKHIDKNPSVLGDKNAVNDAKQIIFQKLDEVAKGKTDLSASDVHNFKKSLGEGAQRIFDKQAKNLPLTQAEEAYLSSWKAVDNSLTKMAPEVKDLTLQQSALYDLAPGLNQSSNWKIPGINLQVPGSGVAGQNALYNAGNAFEAAGTRAGFGLNATGQAITRANDTLGGSSANTSPEAAQAETGGNGGFEAGSIDDYLSRYQAAAPQAQAQASPMGIPGGQSSSGLTKQQIGQLMLADLAKGGKNIAALKTISDFLVDEEAAGPKLTDTAIKTVNDYRSAMDNISALGETLQTTKVSVGPIAGRFNSMNPLDPEAQSLQAQIDVVRQTVGKALEGGVLRKEDEAKYQKILPTMADTSKVAQNKITQLKTMLERDYERYIQLQNSKGGGSFNIEGVTAQ